MKRESSPEIGKIVTIKHNGWTDNGVPRFARFHRIREQE
ncbi:hypothetical protein JCM19239_6470 [Vibrio variabilis]|uniref:DNA ligase OB-like domain-containing protein n=1 Tax=Vibrio variabilis TaxID=990271 RepID=A0ABQ0JJA2_9VIBR|nr:hypothetical protein JCM19239_6470 [Vibrio variabilis]